jgi:hypothetical protein
VAERQLPKLNVAGSIPVSRSIFFSFIGISLDDTENGAQVIRLSAISFVALKPAVAQLN